MSDEIEFGGLEEFETNEDAERDGVWVTNLIGNIDMKLRRAGGANRRYTQALRAALKPYRKRRSGIDDIDPEVLEDLLAQVYAKHVVADWRNAVDRNKNKIECTPETVLALRNRYKDAFQDVIALASSPLIFNAKAIEEAADALGED